LSDPTVSSSTGSDADQLAALGIQSEFKREMGLWANFSLGFTYLSPVVGVYTLFAYALATAGPPMFWAFLLVGFGQFLVALTFSEVVAQFPVAGGVYPWARRLWGLKYAWMTGWVYLWALIATIAAVAYGSGPYFAQLLGMEASAKSTVICALIIVAIATVLNYMGTKVLSAAAIFGFAAELLGCLAVGIWLLATHRHHGLGALFDNFGAGEPGNYIPAFVAGALIAMWMYYGFEACGDVAEEVPHPGKVIPKAMRRTIYIGGAAGCFIALALILSVTDFGAVISGKNTDPVTSVLTEAFGTVGMKIVLGVVLISFLSCVLSLQAAASRLIYSYGRDKMIFGSKYFSHFWQKRHIPPYALGLAVVLPAAIIVFSLVSANAVTKLISFAACGIYLGFQMVVLAALRARIKGWKPSGEYRLKGWAMPVNVLALIYGIAAMLNMVWPRGGPDTPFLDNYIVIIGVLFVVGIGLIYMVAAKPYARGDAPYSDAIKNVTVQRGAQRTITPVEPATDEVG
jgi:amino acid transporter